MKRTILSMAALPLLATAFVTTNAAASEGISIFSDTKLNGQVRPRWEYADVKSNGVKAGNSYTNRLQLSATSKLLEVEGLTATLGAMSVNNFGSDNYRVPGQPANGYDIIADDQQAMLSEAKIDYKSGDTTFSAGRTHLNLDNQRFIGTVGWRQMERSYDVVSVNNKSIEGLDFLAAYVYGYAGVVNTTTVDSKSAILHAKYKVSDSLSVTGYGYLMSSISDTFGVAVDGTLDVGAKLAYHAEFATQDDASLEMSNVKAKADASYMNLDLGTNISGVIVGANYEYLSGSTGTDGKTNFNPGFGTNHKFNGWADKFFVGNTGPKGGLIDANVRLGYAAKGFGKLLAIYHDYTADEKMGGLDDLGSEFNILYANALPVFKGVKALVKYASYSKGTVAGYTADVEKAWVMLDYKF